MNADKKIAVIIINWKKYDLTLNCIDSVLKNDEQRGKQHRRKALPVKEGPS